MTLERLIQWYEAGELTDAELCAMIAERADCLQAAEVGALMKTDPQLRTTLLRWLDHVAQGADVSSSEKVIHIPSSVRQAAGRLHHELTTSGLALAAENKSKKSQQL